MRRVDASADFRDALDSCRREAAAAFKDDRVLLEKYVLGPRHIEVQVFGDRHGHVVHLFERDCSLQRRHQKVIEEAPAPGMDEATRAAVCAAAVKAAAAVDYVGAGTVEFIADASDGLRADRIWFMEMNTRLQVEHPVTEAITGQDLVEWQLRVAKGEPLPLSQADLAISGWAMEARLYAENPTTGFLPSTGRLDHLRLPSGIRVDSGVEIGGEVTPFYDPMIAKLIVHGDDRAHAIGMMLRALGEFEIGGVKTLVGFHKALLSHPCFREGATCHGIVESEGLALRAAELEPEAPRGPSLAVRTEERVTYAEVDGRRVEVKVLVPEPPYRELARRRRERAASAAAGGSGVVTSPMQGTVLQVRVGDGDEVEVGQVICIVEAMKMENEVTAHRAGVVSELAVGPGQPVSIGQPICSIEPEL
jgi:3-methylcrotonyl-CoA carboxylase alpha subunit